MAAAVGRTKDMQKMSAKDAIEQIRKNICQEKSAQRLCRDNCVHGPEYCAYSLAIEALEKQIPKKPDLWGDGYSNGHLVYDTGTCPKCGADYEVDYEEADYCGSCGQRLDWGMEENE